MSHNFGYVSDQLVLLPETKQLAIMAALCERMMSPFFRFCQETDYKFQPYRDFLDVVWTSLSDKESGLGGLNVNLPNPPDSEDYDHPLSDVALDVTLSIFALARYCKTHEFKEVVDVTQRAQNIVAIAASDDIIANGETRSIKTLMQHPLMQDELAREASDLELIKSIPDQLFAGEVQMIRKRSASQPHIIELI